MFSNITYYFNVIEDFLISFKKKEIGALQSSLSGQYGFPGNPTCKVHLSNNVTCHKINVFAKKISSCA